MRVCVKNFNTFDNESGLILPELGPLSRYAHIVYCKITLIINLSSIHIQIISNLNKLLKWLKFLMTKVWIKMKFYFRNVFVSIQLTK